MNVRENTSKLPTSRLWGYAFLPVVAVAVFIAMVDFIDPLIGATSDIPPADSLKVERLEVTPSGFAVKIRAESPEPISIAQLQVDGAFWKFTQSPKGPLHRLQSVKLSIPFPWVTGETHHLRFITSTGVTVDESVEIAVTSPQPTWDRFWHYGLLGICVGFAPIVIGMLFFPVIRNLREGGLEFVLAMTIGMLTYLFIDLTLRGLEVAGEASSVFQGGMMIWFPMALTFGALATLANQKRRLPDGLRAAILVAVGIGLHNFGEGLAIGASLAVNEIALGTFLILGFTFHNVTEGVGIVSPLTRDNVRLVTFVGLALLAGLPVVPGIWIGAFSFAPHWAAILFGIGAGAVIHVVLEIDRLLGLRVRNATRSRFSPIAMTGYGIGAGLMYGTSLLISV